jgi:KUP system potassium uptake protein
VIHTSQYHAGQIYMPTINAVLAVLCIILVLTFRSSDRLGSAYGLAVTVTMLSVSITYCTVARKKWGWPWWRVALVAVLFLQFDVSFFIGNLPKLVAGGWIPAVIALCIFTLFTTWVEGRRRFAKALARMSTPVDEFLREVNSRQQAGRADGTAIVLTASSQGIPIALRHEWLRHEMLHELIILMTVVHEPQPHVPLANRVHLEHLAPNLIRLTAHYGFMQTARICEILELYKIEAGSDTVAEPVYYFLTRPRLVPDDAPGAMRPWRRTLYGIMLRSARSFSDSLGLPPDQVVELGVSIPV